MSKTIWISFPLLQSHFSTPYQVALPSFSKASQQAFKMDAPSAPVVIADPINAITLPIFALIGIIITYFPAVSFWKYRNVAALSLVAISGYLNLTTAINAFIWPNDDWSTWYPGYGICDVEVVLRFPVTTAFATALCCLSKNLAEALDTENAVINTTKAMKRRKMWIDIAFCWGIPFLQAALHILVTTGRYSINPVFGCSDGFDNSWPTIVIELLWCPVFLLLNIYFASKSPPPISNHELTYLVLTLVRLHKHRKTLSTALSTTGSGLPARKFMKLVLISLSIFFIYFPVQMVYIYKTYSYQISNLIPYSYARIHDPLVWNPPLFLATWMFPQLQYQGWSNVAMAAVLFLYFGFNDESVDAYRRWSCKLGLGKLFPSLKQPRQRRGSTSSRGSFGRHLDLVGKCMRYFDGSIRKASHATRSGTETTGYVFFLASIHPYPPFVLSSNITDNNHRPQSRENSTFDPSTTSPHHTKNLSNSTLSHSTTGHHSNLDDIIAIANLPSPPTTPEKYNVNNDTISIPSLVSRPFGAFSFFRTSLNLPLPLFSSKHKAENPQIDLEAATPSRREKGLSLTATPTTIRTNIWSCSSGLAASASKTQSQAQGHGNEDIDPFSPKLGSRAYRERERREMEAQQKRSSVSGVGVSERQDVCQGYEKEGVVVKTLMERKEELASASIPALEQSSVSAPAATHGGGDFDHVAF